MSSELDLDAASHYSKVRLVMAAPFAYHESCGNGGGLVCYRFLAGLASKHRVTLVAFRSSAENDELSETALRTLGVDLVLVDRPRLGRVRWHLFRLFQPFLELPPEARELYSPAMLNALREAVDGTQAQVVIYQFTHMVQYAGNLSNSAVVEVADAQDVFFVSKLRAFRASKAGIGRLRGFLSWLSWVRYEIRNYARCDLIMTLTEQDKAAVKIMLPDQPVFVNEPATVRVQRRSQLNLQEAVIGFAGNFSHPPNREALYWLSEELATAIMNVCPAAKIVVAGMGLKQEEVAELHPAIRYIGFVPDYAEFLNSCSVFLAPLRSGGGIKIKVLEALSAGCPVVTTSIGAEGFEFGAESGLSVSDNAEGLAKQCAGVLGSIEESIQRAERGAELLSVRYGVESRVSSLIDQLGPLIAASESSS